MSTISFHFIDLRNLTVYYLLPFPFFLLFLVFKLFLPLSVTCVCVAGEEECVRPCARALSCVCVCVCVCVRACVRARVIVNNRQTV